VRIELSQTGGIGYFPGLNKPVAVEVEGLDEDVAQELRRLVTAAGFFALPAAVGTPAPGAADYQCFILTIEEDGRRHTTRMLVPIEDPALLALVQAIQKQIKAMRAAGRGAPANPAAN